MPTLDRNQYFVEFDKRAVEQYHLRVERNLRASGPATPQNLQSMPFRGDRLAGIREFKKLRRRQLAQLAGVDPASIQHLEEGRTTNPRWDTVDQLAEVLDVTNDYLGGAGPDIPYPEAAVLQALERFKRLEGTSIESFDAALRRAAEDPDAPHTVAGWRAFISMSNRAWGKPLRMLKAEPRPIQSAPPRNLQSIEGGGAQRAGVIPLRHRRKGPGRRSS
jgi:transcriptional regulator with XRE-family HTH domain